MNRNRTLLFALFVICLAAELTACNKTEGPTSVSGKMQGKWKLTMYAPDNGKSPLVYDTLPSAEDWEWTFNENGTGFDIENWNKQEGIKENFSYKVFAGDSLWWGSATHDTFVYFISVINADYMVWTRTFVTDTGTKLTEGLYFNKN